jgi:hypothetical protein
MERCLTGELGSLRQAHPDASDGAQRQGRINPREVFGVAGHDGVFAFAGTQCDVHVDDVGAALSAHIWSTVRATLSVTIAMSPLRDLLNRVNLTCRAPPHASATASVGM